MKPFAPSKIKFQFFAAVFCFTAVFLLFSHPITACSSDYLIWQVRSKNADPLYRFIKGDKAGYIDQTGKIVVEPTLKFYGNGGGEFHDGLLGLLSWEGPYINKTGKIEIDAKYYRSWEFSEGLAAFMPENNGKWGYIDKTGKIVISPRFESYPNGYVYSFSDGLAMINVKNKYGYIDSSGEFVIQPKFLKGSDFKEGFARAVVEGPCIYVGDRDGCDIFNAELIGGKSDLENPPSCKFAFINKSGAFILDERFERAGDFSEGLAAVRKDGKWGFINTKGEMVIQPQFINELDFLTIDTPIFSEGLALVKKGELWGYIDKTGKFVIEPTFENADNFHNGLAVIGKNWNKEKHDYDDYYFINKKGEQAFPETFLLASHFFKGLAHVKLKTEKSLKEEGNYTYKGTFAYIDTKGKKVFVYGRESD